MLPWLESHASEVQAATGAVVGLATIVLAALTGRYVRLTRELSATAREQITLLRESEIRRQTTTSASLRTLASRIRGLTSSLSPEKLRGTELRQFGGLRHADVAALATWAAEIGPAAQVHAISATVGLSWLAAFFERYQGSNPTHGYQFQIGEIERYKASLSQANEALDAILSLLDQAGPQAT